jgi:ABC-type lipoprotein export system ATPase subunit
MGKLGDVVLLAGKHGSGTSRMLTKIFETIKTKPSKGTVEHNLRVLNRLPIDIAREEKNITTYGLEIEKLIN